MNELIVFHKKLEKTFKKEKTFKLTVLKKLWGII
jgi:hypothetical protein